MVEGAASELDPQIFRSFPDKKILQEVFEEYRKNAELTGSTAAAIFNETEGRYHGVEDWNLYEEGLYLYLLAMQNETKLTQKLSDYEKDLQAKKQKAYSKALSEVDALLNSFNENQANLVDVLKKLSAIREPEQGTELKALLDEVRSESKDQSAVEIEVKRMAEKVTKLLNSGNGESKDKLRSFNEKFQEFQTSRISPQAFALFLKETILENRLPLKVSNWLLGLMDHQKTLRQIEGTQLFKDFEAYAASVKESLLQNDKQRNLDQETGRVHLLKKLIKLELSIEDWEILKKESGEFNRILPENLLNAYRSFYENAEKRDHAFAANMTKQINQEKADAAILISGGFHTQGVSRELKEKGYSCVTVFPEIGAVPRHSLYQDHMAGQVSWKDYLQVEDGKIDVFKAFIRATRDKLLKYEGQHPVLLKSWRDQIIRDLSANGKIESVSSYTQFLDESVTSKDAKVQIGDRFAPVNKFIEGLKSLQQKNEVTQQNVLQLLKAGTILDGFGIPIRHDSLQVRNNGLRYENGRLMTSGGRKTRSEARSKEPEKPEPKKSEVVNTSLTPRPEWVMGGNPRAIEQQEKAGQEQLSRSQVLPVDGTKGKEAEWAAIGVEIGEAVEGDTLFRHVTLPAGWKIKPTDHSMWSDLVDAEGKVRANIFYKAAFYDRRASVNFARSEVRQDARLVFNHLIQNNLDAPTLFQLSDRVAQYDRDAVISELERLKAEAERDAALLGETGATFLSFGAKEFANEVQVLIDRLRKIPGGYSLGFVVPGSPDSNEIQTAVKQIGGLGFQQVFLQGQDKIGLNGLFKNAGLQVNNSGIQKDAVFLSNQRDAGAVVLNQGDLQGVQVASIFTPIVITESEQVGNPFICDYAVVLQAAVALLIAHEGKAALLKNPVPLLEQYGLIASGYSNAVIQSNGNQLFISAIAVKAYLEWKATEQARVSA